MPLNEWVPTETNMPGGNSCAKDFVTRIGASLLQSASTLDVSFTAAPITVKSRRELPPILP